MSAHAEPLEDRRLLAATIGGLNGDSLVYSGNSAVVIDQGTSASVIGTIAVGGTLTVSVTSGGDASEDVLSIRNEGTGLGQIGVSGSNITYSGLPLATFTGGTGGSNLVVTFNAISLVAIGDLLQNITYQNTDNVSPTTGTRTVGFTINDGLGILSSPISAAVNVVSSLSAGVSGGTLQLNSVPTGATLTLSRSGANVRLTDPTNVLNAGLGVLSIDSHTLEVPLASLTNGIVINGGSGAEIINVDFSGGTPIPLSGLTLNGGAGIGDVLNLDNVPAVGSGGFNSAVYAYSSSDTGSVTLDADSNLATTGDQVAVSFSGLESLSNDGVSANLVFNLPATSGATLALNDQGSGVTRLSLTGSETVNFASPAAGGSMTLNLGANDQTLNVTSLAMPAGAALTIDGDSADTINLNASGLNITGALSLSAGTIAQTQPVAVAGLTTLDAGPTGSITLNNAGNNFGTVAITSALNATLRDTNALDLGSSTISGNLAITSSGAITDSGNLSVTGTATLTAGTGNSITLNSAGNDFATVAIMSALNATLSDSNGIDLGASSVAGTLNVTSNGAITDSGALSVSGSTSLAAGAANDITLNSANDFGGPVAIVSGNNVTLNDTNALDLGGSTISGNLGLTSNGAISDSGNLSVAGTATLAAGAGNNITLNNTGNDFSTVSIGSTLNATLVDVSAIDLGNLTVAGTLNVTSNGNLTDSGNLIVVGTATLTAGVGNSITFNSVGNDFATVAITSALNATLSDSNGIDMGASSVSGALNVTSNGAITDSGNLSVTGTAMLTAGAGNNVTLNSAGNNFVTVAIGSALNATLVDVNSIDLGVSSVAGTLNVTSNGAITDSGTLSVSGSTSLAAGATNDITLNSANDFGGPVAIVSGNNVTLNDTDAIDLGSSTVSGNLAIRSSGAITDSGNLSVVGTATLMAGAGNNVTLNSIGNEFSTVAITSALNATLSDSSGIDLGASTVSGTLNVTSNGAITDSGALSVSGSSSFSAGAANDITLNSANDFSGPVAIVSGKNVTLNDTNALDLGASSISGNLGLTSNGAISDSGNLLVAGTATLSAGAGNSITLNSASNDFVTVAIGSALNATLVDVNSIDLGNLTVAGTLNVMSNGAMTDSGNLSVAGTATLAAGAGNNIALNSTGNDFSTVSIGSALNATLVDANAIDLGTSSIAGTLNVTSNGAITDSGALSVSGSTSLAAGTTNDITLNSANDFGGPVAIVFGNNVTLNDTNTLDLGGSTISGNLMLTSIGPITDSGNLAVGGSALLMAGAGNDITLDGSNDFNTVSIVSGNNVTLHDTDNLDLGASSISGGLSLTSNGAITDSGNLSVAGATTLAAAATNNIVLDQAGNNFGGAVSITSGNNVTLNDFSEIDLGVSTVSGSVTITANGMISDSGVLSVSGSTSLSAGATNDITLNSANDFSGPVAIVSGNNVTLNDTNAIDLGGSTISGNWTLTSNGAITDSGNLSVTGTATLSAGAGNSITLNSAGNDFTTVLIGSALNATVVDANAIDLGNSTVAGSLSVTSNGNLTDSGNLSVTGNANFAVGSGAITLGNAVGETTNFGALTFNTTGAVLISEDSDTVLNGTSIANSLALTSSGAITDAMTASLTVTNNARLSGSSITLGDQAGDTTNFGSVSFSSPGAVTISEDSAMNVGGTAASSAGTLTLVSQTGGITVEDTGLATDLSATGPITFNVSSNEQAFTINPGSAITTSSGGVTVLADDMNLQGTITAAGQTVSLRSSVGTDAINLGSATDATANTLELFDAELDRITAGTIAIGDGSAGSVTISAPINRTSATSLSITAGSSGGITFGAGSLDASGGNITLSSGSGGIVSGSLTTDVSANALSITAGSVIGASGNPLTIAVSSLSTDTSAAIANQFLSEADSTLVSLNAGTATIELSSGTFTLNGSEVLSNNSDVTVNSPAVLNLGGFGETIDALAGSGTITDSVAGVVTLTVGANGGNSAFSGVIQNGSGTVGLTKTGSGTLTLTGTNTFTGATTVNAGSLLIDGVTAAGSMVSVNDSAILGGTGIIGGSVTLSAGSSATLSPGSPVTATADVATGNLTLNAGTTFSVQVNGAMVNTQSDQVIVNGSVNLGNATLNLTGAITSSAGQQIVLIANDGTEAVVGTFNGLAERATVTINGVSLMLSYRGGAGGNDVTLTQAGPMTYTSNGAGAGVLQLRLNGGNVEFVDDGVVVDSRPAATVLNQTLTVNGASGETLTVDYSQGFFDADVLWHGSTGGLNVVGGTFTTGSETFTTTGPGNSGSVVLNNGVETATITYDGASSVNLAGTTINNLSLNLPSTTNSVVLEDSGASNDGVSRLRSLGGSLATTTFANPSGSLTINGSTGSDSVELASTDSTFAGTLAINFGAGSDTLRGALVDAVTLTNSDANGFDGTETSATTVFADVETVIGNGGTLTGQNVTSTWTLNGSPTYSTGGNTLNVSGFATLQGGSGNDQFVISAASPFSLNGGAGSDSFTFTNSGSVTGSVDGGSGTSDTLIGDSDGNAFGVMGTNSGTLSGKTAGWSNIENLMGGVGSDTFTFTNLGFVSGTINGSAGNDTLIGDNDSNDFRVTSTNSGTLTGKTSGWLGIENLTGGNGDDHFTLNAPLSGSVSGLSQIIGDTLDGTMIGDVVLVGSSSEGYSGTQSNIAGGFNGIDLLFSTGGVLVGEDVASIWTLNGSASMYSDGARTLTLNGFTTLQGGSAADSFRVIGDSTFQLRGGDDNDLFDIDARLNGTADGEAGNDTLDASGSTSGVTLLGGAGADSLIGGMFNDSLDGGADNDVLTGNAGNDSLIGGSGSDTNNGGTGTDALFENVSGNVTLSNTALTGAEAGSNSNVERFVLMGSDGNDRLDASAFTGGPVTLLGMGGNDTLIGSNSGGDLLDGGEDNDFTFVNKPTATAAMTVVISGDESSGSLSVNGVSDALASIESVSVMSGSGRDMLDGSAYFGTVTLLGNGGDDVLRGSQRGGVLNGMAGNDSIVGGDGDETILGGANNDTLFGNGGNDLIKGQAHTDSIDGGAGDDTLCGEGDAANNPAGNDTVKGGDGDDWLDGGAGNDRLDGDAGYDTLLGGVGRDRMNGGGEDDSLNGGADNDTLTGGAGHDSMIGGAGNDVLHGGDGDDEIDGQGGADTLLGAEGHDSLMGGAGNDLVLGGDGDDSIWGGEGKDTLAGQAGDEDRLFDATAAEINEVFTFDDRFLFV